MTALDREREPRSRTSGVQDREAGLKTRLAFRRAKKRFGHVPLPTRIPAFDPELLELAEKMSKYTAASGLVSLKLKELVQIKVAAMVGCPF